MSNKVQMQSGYFDNEKKEFVITDMYPRRGLQNYLTRKFRGETYDITFEKSDTPCVLCDGKDVSVLPLSGVGSKHTVVCKY